MVELFDFDPEEEDLEQPEHPFVGLQMTNEAGEFFTIQALHLEDSFKPGLGPGPGTWEHAIVFTDANGDRRWGPLRPYASQEEIIQELQQHGYTLLPPTESGQLDLD